MSKNILVLSPTPSHPQDAGNRKRIFALTKYLQELGATIYFVYCPREWDREIPKDAFDGMNQCWDYFFIAYPVQPAVHRTDDEYFELDAWWDVGIEFAVNWVKLAAEIDMVVCNYIFYSKVLELFNGSVTKVIDTHDIMSNRNYLLDRKLGYRDFFYVSPESEKKALDRAHLVLSIKEDESSWFKCLSHTPVLTIGHLEPEPDAIATREIDYDNIKLGFIGSANPINVRNLETFLDRYLVAYEQYQDKLTFMVGGKVCDALDARFNSKVEIIGKVKEVSEFYDLVDIVVLPFEFSTGLKIKTVEALSWSKPCIGTINAFEGLGTNGQYHSYKTIKELADGVADIVQNLQTILPQLQKDSKSVYFHYTNGVKQSIQKLYQVDWKFIKKHQEGLAFNIPLEAENKETTSQKTFYFNIITNTDFWNARTNEELWLKFWIDNVRKLGVVNIYRTKNFKDITADKLKLYKLGLVDLVHYRELYQIVNILQADFKAEEGQVCFNLFDFCSVIFDRACLEEIKLLQLAVNHLLFYFFNQLNLSLNKTIRENAYQIVQKENKNNSIFHLWDSNINSTITHQHESLDSHILLTDHPISLKNVDRRFNNLEDIAIGISCMATENQVELNKFLLFYRDFLPQHFKLVVFSDLKLTTDSSVTVCPLKDAANMMVDVDLFVCIEKPESISYLLYLCVCDRIPVYAKNKEYTVNSLIRPLDNFTSIPKQYQLFLEKSVFYARVDKNFKVHNSCQSFLEYWLNTIRDRQRKSAIDYSLVS